MRMLQKFGKVRADIPVNEWYNVKVKSLEEGSSENDTTGDGYLNLTFDVLDKDDNVISENRKFTIFPGHEGKQMQAILSTLAQRADVEEIAEGNELDGKVVSLYYGDEYYDRNTKQTVKRSQPRFDIRE